jgi:2'-5' RNA ligase
MGSNLVIAAIPDENDRVWKVSSEKIPHLTVLFLGETDKVSNLEQIMLFVEHAANTTLKRFYLPVDRRGELGEDKADVLFFKKGRYDYKAIRDFRATLLQDNNIKTAYDSAQQFDGPWNPHLTLGYPETPAKKLADDQFGSFYDVQFNKIAVWTGDFEGPDFLLKDYWDEMDALDAVPMDVAMSDIEHHGVKGMRWGVRKDDVGGAARSVGRAAKGTAGAVGRAAVGTAKLIGDVSFEARVADGKAREKVIQTANPQFRKTDLPAIKAKPEHQKAAKLKNRLRNPRDPGTKAYRKDVRETYVKRLETTANSMQNPSGTRQYTVRERGNDLPAQGGALPTSKYYWDVSTRNVVHAAEDNFTTLEVILDDDGFVTDVKKVEKSLAQTADLGAEFLAHVGVKGMHWGVRKEPPAAVTPSARSVVPRGEKRKTKIKVEGGENHTAASDAIKVAQHRAKLAKSGTSALSNAELREVANRLQLEQQVKQLSTSGGKKFVTNLLRQQGQEEGKKALSKTAKSVNTARKVAFVIA